MAWSENYKYKNPDITEIANNVSRIMGIDSGAAGRRRDTMGNILTGAKTEGQQLKNTLLDMERVAKSDYADQPNLSPTEILAGIIAKNPYNLARAEGQFKKNPVEVSQEQENLKKLQQKNEITDLLMNLSPGKPQLAPDGSMRQAPNLNEENMLRRLLLARDGGANMSKNNVFSGDLIKKHLADQVALKQDEINKADTTARYKINEDVKVDLKKIAGEKAVKLDKNLKELEAKKAEIKAEYGKGGSAERIARLKAQYEQSAKVVIGEIEALQKTIQEKDKNQTNLEAAKDLNRIKLEIGKDLNIRKENVGLDKNKKGKEVALDKNLKSKEVGLDKNVKVKEAALDLNAVKERLGLDKNVKGKEAALDKNQQALTASKYKTDTPGKGDKFQNTAQYLLGDKFRKAREIVIQEGEENYFSKDVPRKTVTVEPYDFQQLAKISEAGGDITSMRKYLKRNFNKIEQAYILADFLGFSEDQKEKLFEKLGIK